MDKNNFRLLTNSANFDVIFHQMSENVFMYNKQVIISGNLPDNILLCEQSESDNSVRLAEELIQRGIKAEYTICRNIKDIILKMKNRKNICINSRKLSFFKRIVYVILIRLFQRRVFYFYFKDNVHYIYEFNFNLIIEYIIDIALLPIARMVHKKSEIEGIQKFLERIKKGINEKDKNKNIILDFGCGKGRAVTLFNQTDYFIIGIDSNRYSQWNMYRNHVFIIGDENILSHLKPGSFDIAILVLILMYVDNVDAVMSAISKLVKPGGMIFIQEPNADAFRYKYLKKYYKYEPYTKNYFSKGYFLQLLTGKNFIIEEIWYERFYFPVFPMLIDYCMPTKMRRFIERIIPKNQLSRICCIARKNII